MPPRTWLYRHDEVMTVRPYGIDVDEDGWLWEGCGANRLVAHNLRTNALRVVAVPEMGGNVVYQAFAWRGKLVLALGTNVPYYLVFDPATGRAVRRRIPSERQMIWYGTKTPNDRLILYERAESVALILDGPEAEPRPVKCPFAGQLSSGRLASDGLIYSALADPARVIRFDPVAERFIDERPAPHTEAGFSGAFEHKGVMYFADSAGGRLLPMEMSTGKWLDPVPTPDYGKVYGFIGGAFTHRGKGYFCLSTYRHQSRLDVKTGRMIVPPGADVGVDGRAHRFLDRMLIFDGETQSFDYLVAPEQPDGVPLLCYSWTDGERFAVTGIVIPFGAPGEPGAHFGPWLIIQNVEASEEPGYTMHDVNWDAAEHLRKYRRSYASYRSLYLPEPRWCPAPVNICGPANQYPPGKNAELLRRAARTDRAAYWRELAETITRHAETEAAKAAAITGFVNRALYYNPIQEPELTDPVAVLESHDARCAQGVDVTLALFEAAGVKGRRVVLHHHVVAEAFYDGAWHIADALFFGRNQPARDGRVLSVDELRADLYFVDAYPQRCFAYDEELLMSADGYQVLGYVFGVWGSQPYYSYYLGAPMDCPPTLPTALPVQRLSGNEVRLRWAESIKFGGGRIEYEARVFEDRACKNEIWRATTDQTGVVFTVPERNRMYFMEVRAMDEHRAKNPNTWYPPTRWNFVLVPPEQYGWYGVL
jgi:transglutaminase-like putative cysteine protease